MALAVKFRKIVQIVEYRGGSLVLQLIELKEHEINEIGSKEGEKVFILTFTDNELIDQAWPLLDKELESFELRNGVHIRAETDMKGPTNYIKLYVIYSESEGTIINEKKLENDLEKFKNDFEEYYRKLIERIKT